MGGATGCHKTFFTFERCLCFVYVEHETYGNQLSAGGAFVCEILQPLPRMCTSAVTPGEGFSWERRSMPAGTIARGEGSTARKAARMIHSPIVENTLEQFQEWRGEVQNHLAGQGVERGACL